MKILITGADGMLGHTLCDHIGRKYPEHQIIKTNRYNMNITGFESVIQYIKQANPDVVIHCAAMTNVDLCESKPDLAFEINHIGTDNIAVACHSFNVRMIYISTDYVFSGTKKYPYVEDDVVDPQTVYGRSKLAGEIQVIENCNNHCIIRTGWLYGPTGKNFVRTMLNLMLDKDHPLYDCNRPIKVVNDQVGNPTSTDALVNGMMPFLDSTFVGTVHLTCEGKASWFDFAKEINDIAQADSVIIPCTTEEFPRPAPRPKNSRLFKGTLMRLGLPLMPHWEDALDDFFLKHDVESLVDWYKKDN
jgi:dTDP-4-dehydrorhamnose reductase